MNDRIIKHNGEVIEITEVTKGMVVDIFEPDGTELNDGRYSYEVTSKPVVDDMGVYGFNAKIIERN